MHIGILGAGNISDTHVRAARSLPGVAVSAVYSPTLASARRLADSAGSAAYDDLSRFLAHTPLDVVAIGTPSGLHAEQAIAAIECGLHVLVEKPLARTAAEGEEMVVAARDAGKVLGVAFNRRARHDVQLVRRAVAGGEFGRVYYAKAFWMRRSGIPGMGTWFTNKQGAGGGPLIDLGIHVLDMALYMMGNPTITAVSAATYAELGTQGKGAWRGARFHVDASQPYEVEDLATALIRMEDGATLHLETAWAAYTGAGDDFGVSLFGSHGGAEIVAKDYAQTGTLRVFGEFSGTPADSSPRLQQVNGHAEIIKAFVTSILDGSPMSPSGEEGVDRARLIDAIYRSADLGREVRIDEDVRRESR